MEHLALTMHYHIHVAVESSLITVEPFDIFQLGVFVELIKETVAQASGGNDSDCENDIYPFGDCRPDCTVDKVIHAMHELLRGGFKLRMAF